MLFLIPKPFLMVCLEKIFIAEGVSRKVTPYHLGYLFWQLISYKLYSARQRT
jgi:hypothetical protein